MDNKFKSICVAHDATIIHALKQMDAVKHKLLIVVRDDKFYRLLSIGDIQRAIIRGVDMNSPVTNILRDKTKVASVNEDMRAVKATMKERSNEFMPIVDDENNTPETIDANELRGDIFIKPARLIEFILLNFVGTTTGTDFTELALG